MKKIKFFCLQRAKTLAIPLGFSARKNLKIPWVEIKINTVTMIIFGIITSALTIFYEVVLGGTNMRQWWEVRIIYNVIRFAGAYFLGCLIDWFRVRLNGHWFRRALSDALALSVYQIPIYVGVALFVGVGIKIILRVSGLYILDNLFMGWLYGFILDKTRNYYHRRAKRQK